MQIGLALSGGGIRAAVFHLGVLRRIADGGMLDDVCRISTVSGGSLITAALFARANFRWPRSAEFSENIYPALRQLITTTDLFGFTALGWTGYLRYGPDLLYRRAHVLARLLETRWGITGALRDLPDVPEWTINSVCIDTGKNWRFAKREMGDWVFGRHYDPPFTIAEAAAASAALPYAIGALTLNVPEAGWYRTDPATRRPLGKTIPPAKKVHLWDGGGYENLGLESLFKPDKGLLGCEFLICSDASGPLGPLARWPVLRLFVGQLAAPRLLDICSDQIRSLRARMLVNAFQEGSAKGVLLRMGNSVRDVDLRRGRQRQPSEYDRYQGDQEATVALQHPTDLKAISAELFDRIARHGYELTDVMLTGYAPQEFGQSFEWA